MLVWHTIVIGFRRLVRFQVKQTKITGWQLITRIHSSQLIHWHIKQIKHTEYTLARMLSTTWLWAHSQVSLTHHEQASFNSSSMPGRFKLEPYQGKVTILEPLHIDKDANKLTAKIDKLALNSSLNLLRHSTHTLLDLLTYHVFNNIAEFCYAVTTSKRACILHLLALIVAYNMAIYEKVIQQYTE